MLVEVCRRGAWVRDIDYETGRPTWYYTARPEKLHNPELYQKPPQMKEIKHAKTESL